MVLAPIPMVRSDIDALPWTPIPRCEGRRVLRIEHPALDRAMAQRGVRVIPPPRAARDPVYIWVFPDGSGLLSYAKDATEGPGRFVHTLNTEAGLRRKAADLGITLPQADRS